LIPPALRHLTVEHAAWLTDDRDRLRTQPGRRKAV